jgi:hypothetical protein
MELCPEDSNVVEIVQKYRALYMKPRVHSVVASVIKLP